MKLFRIEIMTIIFCLFITLSTHAALLKNSSKDLGDFSETALSFFKSPESLFPSGQATKSELQNKTIDSLNRPFFKVSTQQNPNITRLIEPVNIYTIFNLLDKNYKKSNALFVDNEFLEQGKVLPLTKTFLYKEPNYNSTTLQEVSSKSHCTPLLFLNDWALARCGNEKGYLDLNQFVLRADFAYAVLVKGKWHSIKYRTRGHVITTEDKEIPLQQIRAYMTFTDRGIITQNLSEHESLPLYIGTRVRINQGQSQVWYKSKIKGHGDVWWQDKAQIVEPKTNNKNINIRWDLLAEKIESQTKKHPSYVQLIDSKKNGSITYLTLDIGHKIIKVKGIESKNNWSIE